MEEFNSAVIELCKVIKEEVALINREVDKYRGDGGKVDEEVKDGAYRALKVFKAKLEHYQAAASQDLVQYQTNASKNLDEGSKRIKVFQSAAKQRLTQATLLIKQLLMKPSLEDFKSARKEIVRLFAENKSESELIASWFESKRASDQGDMQVYEFNRLSRSVANQRTPDETELQDHIKELATWTKEALLALSSVKLPKY